MYLTCPGPSGKREAFYGDIMTFDEEGAVYPLNFDEEEPETIKQVNSF